MREEEMGIVGCEESLETIVDVTILAWRKIGFERELSR